jgi:putative transposase
MYGRTNHCVYNINYHIVFCPKFRHKIIKGMVEDVVKQLIQEICNTYGYTLIQMESMPDHLHIFLSVSPTIAPTEIVTKLKSITANRVFAVFPNLKNHHELALARNHVNQAPPRQAVSGSVLTAVLMASGSGITQ